MTGAFGDVFDEEDAQDVDLPDNIAEAYVRYHRGNVVGHEEEGLLMYLATLTGWAFDEDCHVNVIGQGPPGSGKSLTKNTVEKLLDDRDTYTKTSASGNAILDSVEWDLSLVAPMDEYDKIDRNIVEVLKSSNPEDGGYSKDRNVEDPEARGGYSPTEVSADANPWVLLYAPTSKKGGIDDELEDRALILYFSNDKHTRRAIGRKEFGHERIDTGEYDDEYIYDTQALSAALRQHVRDLPVNKHYEEDDEGESYLASRTGDTLVYQPPWVWYACEPIFNVDEDYTNRVYGIVNNLIRASALINHEQRNRKEVEVYVDDDSTETKTREAVVVGPQDVANILSCLPTLLSTTHQLTPLKRHILDAVDATEQMTSDSGTTVSKVQGWLDDNDIPHPSRTTLKDRLDELAEDYYLEKWDSVMGPNGQADAYQKHEQGALKEPNAYNLQSEADRDGITLSTDDCVDIDPENPFEGVGDPIRGQPFTETVSDFRAQFTGETEDTSADSFMGPDSGSNSTGTDDESEDDAGQSSLSDIGGDGSDTDDGDPSADAEPPVDLDADGDIENLTEQWLLEAMADHDGDVFGGQHDVTHYIGACDHDQNSAKADMSDTVLDPDHELWQDRPDHADDRVISEADALRELTETFQALEQKGYVTLDDSSGPPAMETLVVAEKGK